MRPIEPDKFDGKDGVIKSALPRRLVDVASECVPAIGTVPFVDLFQKLVGETGAGQVIAFAYGSDPPECLLSRNFVSGGQTLTADYVEGWWREDPLIARVLALEDGDCVVARLEDVRGELSAAYLAKFFGDPGFRTKVAVLVAQDPLRMVLSFYCKGDATFLPLTPFDVIEESVFRLIGRLLATHFRKVGAFTVPIPLAILSERERQVCLGMLVGRKAETIADDMGVKPSSIVTYRRRAYEKLGISSRSQLLSICRPVQA